MAHTHADVLEVHHHDSEVPTVYDDVAYTAWTSRWGPAVTIFGQDGVLLAEYDDIRHTVARRAHAMPEVGERHQAAGLEKWMEWTGDAWTAVCPTDDVALTARDDEGQLICPTCRRRWHVIVEAAWPKTYPYL